MLVYLRLKWSTKLQKREQEREKGNRFKVEAEEEVHIYFT